MCVFVVHVLIVVFGDSLDYWWLREYSLDMSSVLCGHVSRYEQVAKTKVAEQVCCSLFDLTRVFGVSYVCACVMHNAMRMCTHNVRVYVMCCIS